MKTYTCKCGKSVFWGMGENPKPCQICNDCGTTLLKLEDGSFMSSEPHEWTTEESYRDGKLVHSRTYCKKCSESKPKQKVGK